MAGYSPVQSVAQANFVKEKLVTVVVEIAKREWPQQWPELLPTLFQLAQQGV